MITINHETEQPSPKEAYLTRIPEQDKENLVRVMELFEKTMQEQGRGGALVVVGKSLTRPFPRKDIDLLIILHPHSSDLVRENFETEHNFASEDYKVFERVVQNMVRQDSRFQISATDEPAIDPEYSSLNLLAHEGSITVNPPTGQGTILEFIRIPERGKASEILKQQEVPYLPKRPYVILTEVIHTTS